MLSISFMAYLEQLIKRGHGDNPNQPNRTSKGSNQARVSLMDGGVKTSLHFMSEVNLRYLRYRCIMYCCCQILCRRSFAKHFWLRFEISWYQGRGKSNSVQTVFDAASSIIFLRKVCPLLLSDSPWAMLVSPSDFARPNEPLPER